LPARQEPTDSFWSDRHLQDARLSIVQLSSDIYAAQSQAVRMAGGAADVRIVLSVLVLAFAAGTFVQAAAPAHAKMEMPMAMSQIGGDHMSGCDDCMDDPGAALSSGLR
jgi:hypothetical protein